MHYPRTRGRLPLLIAGLMIALFAQPLRADPVAERLENSPRHHEWVDIKTATGRTVRAFVAFPQVDKPVPTVIVIHENRGLTDWVRAVADQLAEAGFVAIAPDLLSGTAPGGGNTDAYPSSDAARQGIYQLDPAQVMTDLDAAVVYARSLDATNDKVAVGGFCWGGAQTFQYATHNPDIAAACVFYGSAPRDPAAFEKIKAPVYGFYGQNDQRITGEVPAITEHMKALGKAFEPVVYDGAGHGFMRSGAEANADPANKTASEAGWKRWVMILSNL